MLRKGQLNRHTRYRPATTTRNTATQFFTQISQTKGLSRSPHLEMHGEESSKHVERPPLIPHRETVPVPVVSRVCPGSPRCLFTGTGTLQVISPSMSNPSRLEHADSSSMGTETATPGKAMSRPGGSPPLRALICPRPLSHLSRRFRRSIC